MCKNCQKEDSHVKCTLCHKPRYCSEQCADIDWEHHSAKCNVHIASSAKDTVFLPYLGEDFLEDRDLENIPDLDQHPLCQDHLVYYRNPSGSIQQKIVSPLIGGFANFEQGGIAGQEKLSRGANPNKRDAENTTGYTIQITHAYPFTGYQNDSVVNIPGDLIENAIYRGNSQNPQAKKLASMFYRGKDKSNFLLWPSPATVEAATLNAEFQVPTMGGNLDVKVFVGDNAKFSAQISGVYQFHKFSQKRSGRLKRKLMGILQRQLREKRKGMGDEWSIENISMFRATDDEGNRVQLTFLLPSTRSGVTPKFAQLIDVEFSIPVRKFRQAAIGKDAVESFQGPSAQNKIQWRCDPKDLNQVTSLFMALEKQSEAKKRAGQDVSHIRSQIAIVDKHRQALELNPFDQTKISATVNATIHQLMKDQWQEINSQARIKKFKDKIGRSELGFDWIEARKIELQEKMAELRQSTGKIKKTIARARKGLIRRELEDLKSAVNFYISDPYVKDEIKQRAFEIIKNW